MCPLASDGYRDHLETCNMKQSQLLEARLELCGPFPGDLVDRYLEFVTYERSYYPSEWTKDFQKENTAFYTVAIGSSEASSLQQLSDSSKLRHIERVQNKELFLRFMEYRQSNKDGREALLFHGMRERLYNIICNQGFDLGHSKPGLYGYGLYFSSTMDYSKAFVKGRPCLLVCKVWVTDTAVVSGNIYVVHNDFAAYPAYLVHY
jgi:hypothetical protein